MSYAIRLPDQLRQHLRAMRKSRGLTQAQLGTLVGVKQARIAEIEADPGAVSLGQLTKILAALGGTLHLHTASAGKTLEPRVTASALMDPTKAPAKTPKKTLARKSSGLRHTVTAAVKAVPPIQVVLRPKKGAW